MKKLKTQSEFLTESFLDFIKQKADKWKPIFTYTDSAEDSADWINVPHDDYPDRVDVTKEAILDIIYDFETRGKTKLVESDIKTIHSKVMKDSYIVAGQWRNIRVEVKNRVGDTVHNPPDPMQIPMLMMAALPVDLDTDLKEWYSLFQTIHPFEDGNGRVGGIVIAAISYLNDGKFLTPRQ